MIVDAETKSARVVRPGGIESLTDAIAVEDVVPGWRMPFSEVFD